MAVDLALYRPFPIINVIVDQNVDARLDDQDKDHTHMRSLADRHQAAEDSATTELMRQSFLSKRLMKLGASMGQSNKS